MKLFWSLVVWTAVAAATPVEVKVMDSTGAVVAGASARLKNALGVAVADGQTSANGAIAWPEIAQGRYWIEVDKEGFRDERLEIEVADVPRVVEVSLGVATLSQSIVVSASRKEELLLESPAPTLLLDRPAIEDTTAQTLEQVLLEQAGSGVYVSRSFGIGFPQINGVGGNRVLVLVDGQRQIGTDNGTRDGIDLDQFTTERIERVEVVKGPSSALYGSDAMGGVINIITRQPQQPISFDLNNNYGSFGEGNLSATLGVRHKKIGGLLSGAYQTFDGYDLNPADRQTTGFSSGENAFIDRNLSPSFYYDIAANLHFRTNANYYRRNATFLNNQGAFSQFSTQERWNIAPTLDWTLGSRTSMLFRGDVSVGRRFDLDRVESLRQFEAIGSSLLHPSNTLQYGLDIRHKQLRRQGLGTADDITIPLGARGVRTVTVRSGWFQDEWRALNGRLTFGIGLRVENNSQFGTNTSPKATAVYRLANAHRLRFSFGRGFRAPDASELYSGFSPGSFGFVGNPELTPEACGATPQAGPGAAVASNTRSIFFSTSSRMASRSRRWTCRIPLLHS